MRLYFVISFNIPEFDSKMIVVVFIVVMIVFIVIFCPSIASLALVRRLSYVEN